MKKWILLMIIALLLLIAAILVFVKCGGSSSPETSAPVTGYTREEEEELPVDVITDNSETGASSESGRSTATPSDASSQTSGNATVDSMNSEQTLPSGGSTELEGAEYTDF